MFDVVVVDGPLELSQINIFHQNQRNILFLIFSTDFLAKNYPPEGAPPASTEVVSGTKGQI